MSCHYNNNFTKMKIFYNDRCGYHNSFVLDRHSDGSMIADSMRVHKILSEDRQFRIVPLDKNGNIIQLSKPFKDNGKKGLLINYINYDAKSNTLSLDYEYDGVLLWWVRVSNPKYTIIGIIVAIAVIKLLISRFRK